MTDESGSGATWKNLTGKHSELLLLKAGRPSITRSQAAVFRGGSNEASLRSDTDPLYIGLSAAPSVDSREISEDLVVDYGEDGRIVGLDIQHASKTLDLSTMETEHLPLPLSA